MKTVKIRNERKEDFREVENLVRDSFWNVYRPGCLEHYVLHQLRSQPGFIEELDFVMIIEEKDENNQIKEKIIGQNVFVKANIASDDGRKLPILTMGPICIANDFKRQGLGKKLLDYCLEKAKDYGAKAICFEGNIDFYGKSGFKEASDYGIRYHGLNEEDDTSFFLCKELEDGFLDDITGVYKTPAVYFVDENEAEIFDKNFSPKEKKTLPGQIFN